jgi:hypothetical protein
MQWRPMQETRKLAGKMFVQFPDIERLEQEGVRRVDHFGRWIAAADGNDTSVAAGAKFGNKVGSAHARHLRIHQDQVRRNLAGDEELDGSRAALNGVNGVTAQSKHCGGDLAADEIVVNEQHGDQVLHGPWIEHGSSVHRQEWGGR